MKAQYVGGDGMMRQGDNTESVEVILRPIGFQCVGDWIPVGLTFIKIYRPILSYIPRRH